MAKDIKVGSSVQITKSGLAKRKESFPGFSPSAMTGFVTNKASKGHVVVAISDGESYILPTSILKVIKGPIMGYKHPDVPTMDRVEEFTEKLHGSGIDYDWVIEETKSSFRAVNAFHTMDEHGGYDAIVDFTVIFPKKQSMEDFTLQFGSASQYQADKHMLRGYLDEIIAFTVEGV